MNPSNAILLTSILVLAVVLFVVAVRGPAEDQPYWLLYAVSIAATSSVVGIVGSLLWMIWSSVEW